MGDKIGYARVSTQDQSCDLQIDALNAAGCVRIFTEKASGAKTDRPQFAAALDYMRPGDTLVVWKLDRMSRSLRHLIETIETLREKGMGFKCLTHDIDTTTASGRLVFSIFAALAEFERGLIQERVNAGLGAARARGRVGGRPTVDEKNLETARKLVAGGDSLKRAAEVSKVSVSTLKRRGIGSKQ